MTDTKDRLVEALPNDSIYHRTAGAFSYVLSAIRNGWQFDKSDVEMFEKLIAELTACEAACAASEYRERIGASYGREIDEQDAQRAESGAGVESEDAPFCAKCGQRRRSCEFCAKPNPFAKAQAAAPEKDHGSM